MINNTLKFKFYKKICDEYTCRGLPVAVMDNNFNTPRFSVSHETVTITVQHICNNMGFDYFQTSYWPCSYRSRIFFYFFLIKKSLEMKE